MSYSSYDTLLNNPKLNSFEVSKLMTDKQNVWKEILIACEVNTNLIIHSCWIWVLIIPFLLKDIQQTIYANLRYKTLKTQYTMLSLSIINCIIVLEFVISLYGFHLKVTSESDKDYYYKVFEAVHYKSQYWSIQHTVGLILSLQFTRMFSILAATRAFGPMIHIISSMIAKVFKFAVIEFGILLIFFCFGRLWFYMLPEYDSNIHAISTLIAISLGNFDLTIFDNSKIYFSKYYGYAYTILFIWMSTITLLNFLIAIITHVYEFKSKIEVGLYLESIVNINKALGTNKRYSSLVSMVPPLNFMTFMLAPIIIWFSSK